MSNVDPASRGGERRPGPRRSDPKRPHPASPRGNAAAARWLTSESEQHNLKRYLTTLRERAWIIALTVLVVLGGVAVYLALADDVYEARADVLLTPVPREDVTLASLGVLTQSGDPSRDVETAAQLITSRNVADRVSQRMNIADPDVRADPVADSNIITITARAETPTEAQNLANGFARVAIDQRTQQFHDQLDQAIRSLRAQVFRTAPAANATANEAASAELARLRTLRGTDDPSMRLETVAVEPTSPASPKPRLSLAAGLLAGLLLGIGGAFAVQVLDPRIRREEDLRRIYKLPLLARIPKEKGSGEGALAPSGLSPAGIEAFRTLRATLLATHRQRAGPSSVLITGASPSEGKTSTSINLAASLASAGRRVILIEADLRRPAVGKTLGARPQPHGIVSVLLDEVSMEDALVEAEGYDGRLKLLLVDHAGEWMADRLSLPAAQMLVAQAKDLADHVIIDSPPLVDVIDALPLAQRVDAVMLVVGLERSHERKLRELGELLSQQGITPVGMVLVGVPRSRTDAYYYASTAQRRLEQEKFTELAQRSNLS